MTNNNNLKQYLKDIAKFQPMTKEEEMEIRERIIAGDEDSKLELYNRHLKFVVHIAKQVYKDSNFITFLDLVNEGNIGLMESLNNFDFSRDNRFMTYAVFDIKQKMFDSTIKYQHSVKSPIVGKDEEGNTKTPFTMCYLDKNWETDEFVGDFTKIIPNEDIYNMDDIEIENKSKYNNLYKLINLLNDNEKKIIINYFGMNHGEERTLEDIGEEMGLSKERIRQIKDNALSKLQTKSQYLTEIYYT